jgi:hypothetical protein
MSMDIRLYTRKQMLGRYLDIDYRDMCYHRQTYSDTIQLPIYHHRTFLVHQQKYDSGSGATKLYVQSDGFSYSGKYIDYGVIDTRQIISETIAYVGVKNPQIHQAYWNKSPQTNIRCPVDQKRILISFIHSTSV